MKTVTIKQVSNGYTIECDGKIYVAGVIHNETYSMYRQTSITNVLADIFREEEPAIEPVAELKEAA
jgi:hypothetical protein